MKKILLNKNWQYAESELQNPLLVNLINDWKQTNLPHDYSLEKPRDPNSPTVRHEGAMQGAGLYYKKEFVVEKEAIGKKVHLEFEGVAGITTVWVNGKYICKHINPYTSFVVDVTDYIHAGDNSIMVHTDSRMKPNSRWYVGTGIYRNVWVHLSEQVSVVPNSFKVVTKELNEDKATLEVICSISGVAKNVQFVVKDKENNVVAEVQGDVEGTVAKAKINVEGITPWGLETPELYNIEAIVKAENTEDITSVRTGIRTIEINSTEGFKLNGEVLNLKGGCIHHDLGILGAATHKAAEKRRVKILKENGFMALRLAHNPFGPTIFEACDELGMLVIEEAFDEWVLGRTSFCSHITFENTWEEDLDSMINRDYNHPSIIMWSTGNEVEERDGSADGFAWSRRLAEKVKSLDSTRPVTASACALFSEYGNRPADGTTGNQALNMAFDNFESGVDLWGDGTEKYFEPLDAAGYNYKVVRYEHDRVKFPNRVIYGSETYPRAALESWQGVENNPNVIGDFVWTAWEYIGEVGTGRWEVSDNRIPADPEWPWLLAYCGDFDVLGFKRPQSYYRDVVWHRVTEPKIFCLPPDLVGKNITRLSWTWDPVQRNYTFPGFEGQDVEVNIYADAEEVELIQNGVSMGKKPCTVNEKYIAVFKVPYLAGKLEVISYNNGEKVGYDSLTTAKGTTQLVLEAENPTILSDGQDLCFVSIKAKDADGVDVYNDNTIAKVKVLGSGELLSIASANPKPDSLLPYKSDEIEMHNGQLMAVIRSEEGSKGCMLEVTLENGITATLPIGFAEVNKEEDTLIKDADLSPLDLPLGELLDNDKTLKVLKEFMSELIENPMLNMMRGMSLKKLAAMGGQSTPEGLKEALIREL